MNAHQLARDLLEELLGIASRMGLKWVTRVELIVGARHDVSAAELGRELESIFANTTFEDSVLEITIVREGQEVRAPGRNDTMVASGWEMLVRNIEGRQ